MPASKSQFPRQRSRRGGCGPVLFGLFWSLITLGFDGAIGYGIWRSWETSSFDRTAGTVTDSEVDASGGGKNGPSYRARIEYDYEVGGQKLHGDQRRAWEMGVSGTGAKQSAEQIVARYRPGTPVDVYYHPDDPARAVLEPGIGGLELFVGMFAMPFNMVMLGIWWAALSSRRPSSDPGAAGSRRIRQVANGWEIVLREGAPVLSMLITLGGLAFVSIFIAIFAAGVNPSLTYMIANWAVVLGGGVIAGILSLRARQTIVLDDLSQSVNFPGGFSAPGTSVSASQIRRLKITLPSLDPGETVSELPLAGVAIEFRNDFDDEESRPMIEGLSEDEARALGVFVGEKLGLTPEIIREVDEDDASDEEDAK